MPRKRTNSQKPTKDAQANVGPDLGLGLSLKADIETRSLDVGHPCQIRVSKL